MASKVPIQKNTGDFRLLDRSCIEALKQMRETERNTKGMYSWIGFRKKGIYYDQKERVAGEAVDASNENYSSIRKYQEKLEEERKSAIEKMPDADPKKEEFASVFNQMSEIKGGTDIVDSEAANNGVKSIDNGLDPKTQRILDIFESNM